MAATPALVCLAGSCATGVGASTRSAGGTRALWVGNFDEHQEAGDGTITRLAGEMLETLELDTASATGTLRVGELSVVGQYTNLSRNAADELPELDDDGAAVMLPTGEFLFADWSPTRVVPKDGSLTDARRVAGLPDDLADLFAAAEILEDARPSGRALEMRIGDREVPRQTFAQLVAYAPAEHAGYIVGVGVIDPHAPALAQLRAAQVPTAPIMIVRADGRSAPLAIDAAHDRVVAWPRFGDPDGKWPSLVRAQRDEYAHAMAEVAHEWQAAKATPTAVGIAPIVTAAERAGVAADAALADLPGGEVAARAKILAARTAARTTRARAGLAEAMLRAIDGAHAGDPAVEAAVADAVASIGAVPPAGF